MQLETYISDLLYRYECVTIPEFGAFLTQRVSASIDEGTNTFNAPNKMLSFNEQIHNNDGLLAHYIADVEKIPFEVANKKIQKRVKKLKAYLTQGETLTFKNIGEIVLNNEGKILFEPIYYLNYLTDSFGLSQFVSPTVTREVYKKEVEAIEEVIPITITTEKRKSKPYLKYAAVALIALTLGGFAASNYYVNQIETHNQLAQEEATKQLDEKIQQATFSLNPIPAITINATKHTGNYHIVAGAFRIEANSIKKVKQLRALGYKARNIGLNKSGLYEVVYNSYENGKDALKAIRVIRKTHNKDAWLKVDRKTNYKKQNSNQTITVSESNHKIAKPKVSDDFGLDNSPNIIKIIKNINTLESGYYLILGNNSDAEKKEAFVKNLKSKGLTNINTFFDEKSEQYFVFHNQKFESLQSATSSLQSKAGLPYEGKMAIVKIEN